MTRLKSPALQGLAIFLLALAVRMAWIATLPGELMWIDERAYAEVARHLAAGDGYVSSSYRANPIVPAYLAAFFASLGEAPVYPRIGQALIGAAGCVVAFRLTTLLAGGVAGVLAGILLAVDFGSVYSAGVFYTACIASVLGLCFVHLLVTGTKPSRAIAAGVVLGLAALTRSTFLVLVPIGCLSLVIVSGIPLRRRIIHAIAFVVATAAIIAPWSLRNQAVYGRLVVISSGFGETLWKGNNEVADGGAGDRFIYLDNPIWKGRVVALPEPERMAVEAKYAGVREALWQHRRETADVFLARDDVLGSVARDYIVAHPGAFSARFCRSVVTLFSAFSDTGTDNAHTGSRLRIARSLQFYPLLALAVFGAVILRSDWRRLFPLYASIGTWAVVHGALTSCSRFRLDVDPMILVFSAAGAAILLPKLARLGAGGLVSDFRFSRHRTVRP